MNVSQKKMAILIKFSSSLLYATRNTNLIELEGDLMELGET